MAASLTPGTAAMTTVLDTAPPGLAEVLQPAARRTASPDAAASAPRALTARRPRFSSRTPAGSSLMTLLARFGIYRHSSGHRAMRTGEFSEHGRCGREYPIAASRPVKHHVTVVFPIRACI